MALECLKNINCKLSNEAKKLHCCACAGIVVFIIIICLIVFLIPSKATEYYSLDSFGSTSQEVLPETGCPLGWLSVGNNCFRIQRMKAMMWMKAAEFCEDQGGFLAEPRTSKTLATINSFIKLNKKNEEVHWWIGLTDQFHEGQWTWVHKTRENELKNRDNWVPWLGGGYSKGPKPNHNDCVLINTGGDGGLKWQDVKCDIKKHQGKEIYAICEMEKEVQDDWGFDC